MTTYIPNTLEGVIHVFTYSDEVARLCTEIYEAETFDDNGTPYPYVPLSSVRLRKVFGSRKFYKVLEEAKARNVIRVRDKYWVGQQYKGYGLTPTHRDSRIVKFLPENKRLDKHEPFKHRLRGVYLQLYRYVQLLEIEPLTDQQIWNIMNSIPHIKMRGKSVSPNNRYKKMRMEVDKIAEGRFYGRRGETDRFYSNLTGLKRELRPFLSVGHKILLSYDLSCSQPSLLSVWIENQYRECFTHNLVQKSKRYLFYRPTQTIEKQIAAFKTECTTNQLYTNIATELNITRDEAKVELLTYLFGEHSKRHIVAKYFKSRYSELDQAFETFKQGQHGVLAGILQAYEASIFIHGIAARIIKDCPGVPFWTIHDSVLCLPEHEHLIHPIIYGEISKHIKQPLLKRESYECISGDLWSNAESTVGLAK